MDVNTTYEAGTIVGQSGDTETTNHHLDLGIFYVTGDGELRSEVPRTQPFGLQAFSDHNSYISIFLTPNIYGNSQVVDPISILAQSD